MSDTFMERLTSLRVDFDQPMVVTSAYRCPNHPIEARKASPGAHASGHAVDIGVRGKDAYKLLNLAFSHGFTGIGVNQMGDSRFIHLDDLTEEDGKYRSTVWSY